MIVLDILSPFEYYCFYYYFIKEKTGNLDTATNCTLLPFIHSKSESVLISVFSSIRCHDRPRVIDSLRGRDVVDIACGGAHSAVITASGELYTWGKGRYGRLGHGDSDDQLKPKLVEGLLGN